MNYLDSHCPGVSPVVLQVFTRKALEVLPQGIKLVVVREGSEVLETA